MTIQLAFVVSEKSEKKKNVGKGEGGILLGYLSLRLYTSIYMGNSKVREYFFINHNYIENSSVRIFSVSLRDWQ